MNQTYIKFRREVAEQCKHCRGPTIESQWLQGQRECVHCKNNNGIGLTFIPLYDIQ